MKAIDKLIELRKTDSSIVAIAKDAGGDVFYYTHKIPKPQNLSFSNNINCFFLPESITFDSDNWKECIVTINDLPKYEVKMMSISVQDYERLVQAEKTLENIKKFLS